MDYEKKIKMSQAKLDRAKHPQIIMSYEVSTSLDKRVCPGCSEMEGLKDDVFNAVVGVNHPPFHDGCRCVAYYSVEGIKENTKE